MKASQIYFVALEVAEAALPPDSKAVMERYDAEHKAWGKSGYGAVASSFVEAEAALKADPCASAAMEIRRLFNVAALEELKGEKA